jgi:hypothetical protein
MRQTRTRLNRDVKKLRQNIFKLNCVKFLNFFNCGKNVIKLRQPVPESQSREKPERCYSQNLLFQREAYKNYTWDFSIARFSLLVNEVFAPFSVFNPWFSTLLLKDKGIPSWVKWDLKSIFYTFNHIRFYWNNSIIWFRNVSEL